MRITCMVMLAHFFKIVYLLSSRVFAGGVTISPSNEDAVICAQDNVTFTCALESAQVLQWVAEPFITRREILQQQVIFTFSDVGKNHTVQFNGVAFHAVLTQSEPTQGSSTHYSLQSTLSTTASTATNGTVIECINLVTGVSVNSTLQLQVSPSQPSNISYSITSYGISNMMGEIEWNSSMDSSVDNFTITISSMNGTTKLEKVPFSPLKHVCLNYNTNYTISIRASNCAGNSVPGVLLFMESGCLPPGQPVNGSVSGFTSAKVGSEVTYHCNEGLNLVGRRVAVCTLHLVWDPMGSKVMCEPPPPGDCADFGALANGTVIFSNSTENASVIKFQCGTGFFLVGSNVAQCRSGQWSVQPQDVQCTSHPLTSQDTTSLSTYTPTTTNIISNSTTTSSPLAVGALVGIVVALLLLVFIPVVTIVIFVLLIRWFKFSKKSDRGFENGATTGNSYTTGEEIVELQEVHNFSVEPATYSAVGHVQESPPMEVSGTYYSSNGVPTTYSSVVHVQAGNGSTTSEVKIPNKGLQYAELVPTAFSSPPVALLMHTQNKVQYSTVDHIPKAPAGPLIEPVISAIDRNIDAEQIQLQLVDVRPEWRKLGCAVGLPPQFLDEVHASYEQDKDRLAEVVYKWCSQVESIRWADVAVMCRTVGYFDLADALDKAYQTGLLPVDNCNDPLPLTPSFKALPPPPIPPREARESSPPELPPPPTPDVLEGLIPPTDDCQFPPPLPQKPHTIKAPAPPPRPPRHF